MITSDLFPILDYWFYEVGVNVWPANTRDKRLSDNWKAKQDEAMSAEEYEEMKKQGDYIKGAAVITGKVWRGANIGYYLEGIDLDNKVAIEEFLRNCANDGKVPTLQELS